MARMYDPSPDSIISLLSRRDVRTQSEQLKLVIDSYHDRQTAYQFAVSPAGVKRDYYVSNDTNEESDRSRFNSLYVCEAQPEDSEPDIAYQLHRDADAVTPGVRGSVRLYRSVFQLERAG